MQDLTVTGPVQAKGTLSLTTLNGNIVIDGSPDAGGGGGSLSAATVMLSAGSNSTGLTQLPQSSVEIDTRTFFNTTNPQLLHALDGEVPLVGNVIDATSSTAPAVLVAFRPMTASTTSTVVNSDDVVHYTIMIPNDPNPATVADEARLSTITATTTVAAPAAPVTMPAWHGDVTEINGGTIQAGTLTVQAPVIGGATGFVPAVVDLQSAGNRISNLGTSVSTGAFSLTDSQPLVLTGPVVAGVNNYDKTVTLKLTALQGDISGQGDGAVIADLLDLRVPQGAVTLGNVFCFCGAVPQPSLPAELQTIPFIPTDPQLAAALSAGPPSQALRYFPSVQLTPQNFVLINGPPSGLNQFGFFMAPTPDPPPAQFFFTPGIGGLNVAPAIQTISYNPTPASFGSGSPIVKASFGSPVQPPAYGAPASPAPVGSPPSPPPSVAPPVGTPSVLTPLTVTPPAVTPPTVTPPTVTPLSNGTVPNPADTQASVVPSGGQVAQAVFTGMCVTPAGMCPQRSYSPIVAGTGCTCSGGGKTYPGVIQRNPPQ